MPLEDAFDRVGHVAQQVKAIGHLDRVGRARPCTVGVRTRPIAADDLNAGMRTEPRGECGGRPIGEQINHSSAFQIDQQRAVRLAPSPRPVVDTQYAWCGREGDGLPLHDHPAHRVAAHGHPEPLRQPRPCLAPKSKSDRIPTRR